MAAARSTNVRLVPSRGTGPPVLTLHRGRVKGEAVVQNPGRRTLTVRSVALRAKVPGADGDTTVPVELGRAPLVVAPGASESTVIRASLDPLTPPGTYDAEIIVDDVSHAAVVQVNPVIVISLSETELVISAEPETEQVRHVIATNLGNVPLPLGRVGPAELKRDAPRPTLLQRLGVLPAAVAVDCEDEPRSEEERPPTVAARLAEPVTLTPGEAVASDWVVTVRGAVRPGVRYRAVAPVYTTDITFVATPRQEEPPVTTSTPRARATRAARQEPERPRATRSSRRERRES
jgi:hypothetical protein